MDKFPDNKEIKNMPNKKNQSSVGQMIQRCHKWRQKRKQYMDKARQTSDEIERERLMQAAEHYGRIVNAEQGKIDSTRTPGEKTPVTDDVPETESGPDEDETIFPDFITDMK